jgi:hypothetical protein
MSYDLVSFTEMMFRRPPVATVLVYGGVSLDISHFFPFMLRALQRVA